MKQILVSCFILLSSFVASPVYAQALDEITSFSSQITINQNTSLTIQETLNYSTSIEKHGIFRYIPLTYARDNHIYSTKISAITVTNTNHQNIPYTSSHEAKNLVLKIGDPNRTFTGNQTYML